MTLTKLNGNESGVIIAKLINALIDEKASIDLSDLDATGEQRFTDLNTAISTLNTALSTLTTTVNKKVEATVSLAANGYIKFDKGNIGNNKVILQWGICTSKDGDTNGVQQTLPTSFSNTNYKVVVTAKAIGAVSVGSVSIDSSSKFTFCAREGTKGSTTYYAGTSYYIALGC